MSSLSNDDLLDNFQRVAFHYFVETVNPENGLVPDTSRAGSPCSIAVVGFALSSYPIGVERGWMSREAAVKLTLATLRFFRDSPQSSREDTTGYKGFYYHFLDLQTGRRVWNCELSMIDTALLFGGVLLAGAYFTADSDDEQEIRELADFLYQRVDWRWAQSTEATMRMGWLPKSGFLHYGWDGYSESTLLYTLGMASPTYRVTEVSHTEWMATFQWENIYNYDLLYGGPLFLHQFSHAWIDFRGIRDPFMREKKSDYFENSRRATYLHREYARRNPNAFLGYGDDLWGLSAAEGPGNFTLATRSGERSFFGYAARGAPFGPDDGTIAPWSYFASLPFAPEIVMPALRHLLLRYPSVVRDYKVPSGFNPTLANEGGFGPDGWISDARFGLDQGIMVLMVENYRSGLVWEIMRSCPQIRTGLRMSGFTGGWLSGSQPSKGRAAP